MWGRGIAAQNDLRAGKKEGYRGRADDILGWEKEARNAVAQKGTKGFKHGFGGKKVEITQKKKECHSLGPQSSIGRGNKKYTRSN